MVKKNIRSYSFVIAFLSISSQTLAGQNKYPEVNVKTPFFQENIIEKKNKEELPQEEMSYADKLLKNYSLDLKDVKIHGNKAISADELKNFYTKYLGKKIGYNEIVDILESINKEYKKRGYFLSYVLPDKNFIDKDVINIKIIEGSIKVHLFHEFKENKLLKQYVDNIEGCNPITKEVYERNIELIQNLPGLEYVSKSRLNVEALKSGSSKILDLYILSDKYNAKSLIYIDNISNNQRQGPLTIWNVNNLYNLLNQNETIKVAFETSGSFSKRRNVQVGLHIPLNSNSLAFSTLISKKHISNTQPVLVTRVDLIGPPSYFKTGIVTDKLVIDSKLSYSPILSFTNKLTTSLGYQIEKVTNKDTLNNLDTSRYRTPKLYLEADYFVKDKLKGDNYLNTKFSTSGKFLGGKNYMGNEIYKSFNILSLDYTRRDSFPHNFVTILQTSGQLSNKTLPWAEKFSYGGGEFGKAYHAPIIVGDSGINASLKAYKLVYIQNNRQISLLTPYIYVDSGFMKEKYNSSNASASSFGTGVEVFMKNGVRINYSLNKPITFKNVSDVRKNKINHVIVFTAEYKF